MGLQARRNSVFRDTGVDDTDDDPAASLSQASSSGSDRRKRLSPSARFRSEDDVHVGRRPEDAAAEGLSSELHETPDRKSNHRRHPSLSADTALAHPQSPLPVRSRSTMYRFGAVVLLLAAVVPLLHSTSFFGHASIPLQPVDAGPIPESALSRGGVVLDKRVDSPTDVCFRWAQQSALLNGTLYLYGGEATTEPSQTSDTWNNNFLSLDLTKTWQIATPSLTGLPQPVGPPNVSLGYLWNSYESLYLYGGEYSWKPAESPAPFSLWEYSITDSSWIEHNDPVTSAGTSAPSNDDPVQRAAEGAGITVPSLGRGFYFGGHLDGYTTEGWSQSIARVYLQSLLEYTFPGYTNNQVDALSNNQVAGSGGTYRNVTEGGQQSLPGFTQRADGLLIYVPGFGDQGILLALAGGTNESYTQMNNINVYDIANSTWYTQTTTGTSPALRVNPCAVIAAAEDGSSYNIYMFGGQNLIPYGNQTQFNDMWILTLPSFTWIEVDQSGQNVPYGRSGHTCNVWDAQMVMVGGYTGSQDISCESPGIYVFDMSALEWVNQFNASSPGTDDGSSSSSSSTTDSTGSNNPFNQQLDQKYSSTSSGGLEGSYGYEVPNAVVKVIGGDATGGATLTTPVNTATAGPLATGKAVTYTVTNANGSTTTSTSTPDSGGESSSSSGGGGGPNVGAIVAGCVAGFFFLLAGYLAFCAFVYRKRLALYKRHVEMSQAQARGEKLPAIAGLLATNSSTGGKTSLDPNYRRGDAQLDSWTTNTSDDPSRHGSGRVSGGGGVHSGTHSAATGRARQGGGTGGYNSVRRSSEGSHTDDEDLLAGREPTFVGVLLNPRRSLRVINRD